MLKSSFAAESINLTVSSTHHCKALLKQTHPSFQRCRKVPRLLQAQREAKESSAKEAYYREALQELTLFKSRTSASLLQAQEQLQSAKRDAEEMEVTYQTAWTTAQANHSKNSALLEELSTVGLHNLPGLHFCKTILSPAIDFKLFNMQFLLRAGVHGHIRLREVMGNPSAKTSRP